MNLPLRAIVSIAAIALLPFVFQPLRFEAYESQRADVLALLVLLSLPFLPRAWKRADRAASPLLLAALLWCAALLLSSVFSLSPARSFFGDVLRRMGLWTQLALVACLFFGAWLSPARAWRWFWLAGVVVAAHVLAQRFGLLTGMRDARPPGLFGSATFTGGWLALACLWVGIGLARATLRGRKRPLVYAGLALMLAALLLTESRGAALALLAGAVTAWLAWIAVRRYRRGVRLLWLAAGLGTLGLAALIALDTADLIPANLPVISRLRVFSYDQSIGFRQGVWLDGMRLARAWPAMSDLNDQPDRGQFVRPLLGYGLENFYLVHQPTINKDLHHSLNGRRIDRVHNDWLDTLVAAGWLGLLTRAALWGCVWWGALKRLGLAGRGGLVFPLSGGVCAAVVASQTPLLPLAVTLGLLGGAWLWLIRQAQQPALAAPPRAPDAAAWTALAVLAASLIDMQFSFVTVATGVPAWLAFGLLLTPRRKSPDDAVTLDASAVVVWLALAGAFLLRGLHLTGATPAGQVVLALVMALASQAFVRLPLRGWLPVAPVWALGWLAGTIRTPALAALPDVLLLLGGLWLLAGSPRIRLRPAALVRAAVALLALLLFALSVTSDVYLRLGQRRDDLRTAAENVRAAAALRPWDTQIAALAGASALRAALEDLTASDAGQWLGTAHFQLERAAALNPYDGEYALRLAVLETALAQVTNERELHQARSAAYFTGALRLLPRDLSLWRTWGEYLWNKLPESPDSPAAEAQVEVFPASVTSIED